MLFYSILCYYILCYFIPFYAMLFYVILLPSILCYAIWYSILCYSIICYSIIIIIRKTFHGNFVLISVVLSEDCLLRESHRINFVLFEMSGLQFELRHYVKHSSISFASFTTSKLSVKFCNSWYVMLQVSCGFYLSNAVLLLLWILIFHCNISKTCVIMCQLEPVWGMCSCRGHN